MGAGRTGRRSGRYRRHRVGAVQPGGVLRHRADHLRRWGHELPVKLSPFCKLADPAAYQACDWDLSQDIDGRTHWCDFFKRHFETILKLGVEAAVARGASHDDATKRARSARTELAALFDDFLRHPQKFGRTTMLEIDTWRDEILRKWSFP